jgi:hypothetical protein
MLRAWPRWAHLTGVVIVVLRPHWGHTVDRVRRDASLVEDQVWPLKRAVVQPGAILTKDPRIKGLRARRVVPREQIFRKLLPRPRPRPYTTRTNSISGGAKNPTLVCRHVKILERGMRRVLDGTTRKVKTGSSSPRDQRREQGQSDSDWAASHRDSRTDGKRGANYRSHRTKGMGLRP